MDGAIIGAVIGAVALILVNQWILHHQNRQAAKAKDEAETLRDNRLAFLLENFPPHRHSNHSGITYPTGMHPGLHDIPRERP